MTIKTISCDWETQGKALSRIREEVFVQEQKVPIELEWDGEDPTAWHILAYYNDQPAGTARVLSSGQIGRMSVLKPYRRLGIGAALLAQAERLAQEHGLHKVFLHSQSYIQHFYQAYGYQAQGEEFMDAGIPHIEMVKHLNTCETSA